MDIDLSDSDLSRLVTMLTTVGAGFTRSHGPGDMRIIEIGNVVFEFDGEGELTYAGVDLTDGD